MGRWWGVAVLALAGTAVLFSGCGGSGAGGGTGGGDFQAAALADAGTLGYQDGANLVRWQRIGSRAVAYLIYRDTNPYAPVAVADGYATYFIDSASPLPQFGQVMESTEVEVTLDTSTGAVNWSRSVSYDNSTAEQYQSNLQTDEGSFSVTARRVPLQAGASCGYMLRVLFVQYDSGGLDDSEVSHPDSYRLLLGNLSDASPRITLMPPPALQWPNDGAAALDGRYRCSLVPAATQYTLQLSPNGAMYPVSVTAAIESATTAAAFYSLNTLAHNASFRIGSMVYWRMGARAAGQPAPIALADRAQNGWVFSLPRQFVLPAPPPANP